MANCWEGVALMRGPHICTSCGHVMHTAECSWINCKCQFGCIALTAQEVQILRLLALNNTPKDIANQLNVAVKTACVHRTNIMRKLGIHKAMELAYFALKNNVVKLEETKTPAVILAVEITRPF